MTDAAPTAATRLLVTAGCRAGQWQAQWPPQPPAGRGAEAAGAGAEPDEPTEANTDSRRAELTCPAGHSAGSLASAIDLRASKVVSQVLQRYS